MGIRKYRDRWVADYRDADGKRRVEVPQGPFENAAQERTAAQALLTKRLAEVAQGRHQPLSTRPTVAEICDRFMESKVNIRPTTRRNYATLIEMYIKPLLGRRKVQAVTAEVIERLRFQLIEGTPPCVANAYVERRLASGSRWSEARAKQRAARLKPGVRTINKLLTMLTMILGYACKHRWIEHNPAEHIERLRDTRPVDERAIDNNILTPDEIRRLLDATDDGCYRMIITTGIFTGMRQGELLGLMWGDIDWNSRQIHVRRAWKEGTFSEPKTRNSIRKVDLPDFLMLELKKWKLRCPKRELDLVFPNGSGNPQSHSNLLARAFFYPALRRAGLRKIRFHDLRHSFASLMLANGTDVVRVSRLLGHSSPVITMTVYAHQLPKEHYDDGDRLAKLVCGESNAPISTPPVDAEAVVVPFPVTTTERKP